MNVIEEKWNADWVWAQNDHSARNSHVLFRRTFEVGVTSSARIRLTADSRYVLYVNGRLVGRGPARSWPQYWSFDSYDLVDHIMPGRNVVAILVIHYGEGTMQYLPASPGLTAEILLEPVDVCVEPECLTIYSDSGWKARCSPWHLAQTPRMCLQMAFEEQYDARGEEPWTEADFNDEHWPSAMIVESPHIDLTRSGLPILADELVRPTRVLNTQTIRPVSYAWTLNLRPYLHLEDMSANPVIYKGYLCATINSPCDQEITLLRPHWYHQGPMLVGGEMVERLPSGFAQAACPQKVQVRKGPNFLLIPLPDLNDFGDGVTLPGTDHFLQFTIGVDSLEPLSWRTRWPDGTECEWAFLGPFHLSDEETCRLRDQVPNSIVTFPKRFPVGATDQVYSSIWTEAQSDSAETLEELLRRLGPIARRLDSQHVHRRDVFTGSIMDTPVGPAALSNPEALRGLNDGWSELHPAGNAEHDVRFLLDFGTLLVGDLEIEVDAYDGVILDFHGFEFIQKDGRQNYAEDMSNTLRYICRAGQQHYRSVVRRGGRYVWVTVRNFRKPVRFRRIDAHFVAYPQRLMGSFRCSDSLLEKIWQVGAHTLRCCSEDTYTDCPTYEQVFWVGDARNEALVDWMVNGDPRLWYRCLELAGRSLDRSPIVESHVPSSSQSIIPAWSFLWMRSCREYLLHSGDEVGAIKLFADVEKNVSGIVDHLNSAGLFEIRAWNMFDWAEMDTPADGVVTHNNCFAVLALEEAAQLALWLGRGETGQQFRDLAASLRSSINRHLWSEDRGAYVDSIHKNGRPSAVFSQQTHAVALLADVPQDDRVERVRNIVYEPPSGFVRAGSPFFQFFVLELLQREGRAQELLDAINKYWGFMIEQGADTFWEMWSLRSGRLTRSHCHGWSSAPTFFLSSSVLGVVPVKPGFAEIDFRPQLGHLEWAEGTVPTPHGPIYIRLWRENGVVRHELTLPPGILVRHRDDESLPVPSQSGSVRSGKGGGR